MTRQASLHLISSFPDLVVLSPSLDLPKEKKKNLITGHLKGKIVFVNQICQSYQRKTRFQLQ